MLTYLGDIKNRSIKSITFSSFERLKLWWCFCMLWCWHIISDQIPPCITELKLAFVTMFLYIGSKDNEKWVSPSCCGFIDKTVPVTVTHWVISLNRPRGFAMKFHNEELHLLEDIVKLIVIRNCHIFIVQKRYSSDRRYGDKNNSRD